MSFIIPDELAGQYARLMTHQLQLASYALDAQLRFIVDPEVPTALTDCRTWVRVNPEFMAACLDGSAGAKGADIFVLAHEIMHCMLFHDLWLRNLHKNGVLITPKLLTRITIHNPRTTWCEGMVLPWHSVKGLALDYVINALLVKFGLTLYPYEICLNDGIATWNNNEDESYASCFGYYGIEPDAGRGNPEPAPSFDPKPGAGGDDTDAFASPVDELGDEAPELAEPDPTSTMRRKLAVAQALQDLGKAAGMAPGHIQMLIDRLVPNKLRWRELVQVDVKAASGRGASTWSRIRSRSLTMGTVLPGTVRKQAGTCVFQTDVSGSVGLQEKRQFGGALLAAMRQVEPKRLILLDVDAKVQQVREPKTPQELVRMIVEDGFKGGGGTNMRAAYEWCEDEDIQPDLLCTLTDGYTPWPDTMTPAKRSLWLITTPGIMAPTAAGVSVHMPLDDV